MFQFTIFMCEIWGFHSDVLSIEVTRYVMLCPWANCFRRSQGSQCLHCQGDFTLKTKALLSLSFSRSVVNISPIDKEWHPKHISFSYIIVFFRWFEAKFGVCFSFFKTWRCISTYLPMYVRTAPFIYEILLLRQNYL